MQKNKENAQQSEKDLKITMWCLEKKEREVVYTFQLQARSARLLQRAAKGIQGLNAGTGYDRKKKERILLIKKSFPSTKELKDFMKNFEYDIEKVDS